MKLIRMVFTGAVLAVVVAACGGRDVGAIPSPLPPLAAIRYFNAIPDTGPVNFRLVDNRIEWSPNLISATFRAFSPYQPLGVGNRDLAIFHDDSLAQYATQIHAQTTIPAVDDERYTVIYAGFLRAAGTPADQPLIFTDNPPMPAPGNFNLRLIHAGAGLGNVDLIVHRTTAPVPAPQQTNIAFGAAGAYIEIPVSADSTDRVTVRVRATGTTTDVATLQVSIGAPGIPRAVPPLYTPPADPIPGSLTDSTSFTYVLTPRSVAGSQAPQTMTTPALSELLDRRPPPVRVFP